MKSKRINSEEWASALGVHSLFKKVTDSVINNYLSTTPVELVEMILNDPCGTNTDGLVTIYPIADSEEEYSLRTYAYEGKVHYSTDLKRMDHGKGGFLKHCSTLEEPFLYENISSELTDDDELSLPWITEMSSALVIPTLGVSGGPATTVLFAKDEGTFDGETVKSNIFLTHATTNIILTWIHRMESVRSCEALDDELATLGRVQRELLPSGLPQTNGFQWAAYYSTSTRAGGDYYDFFTLPDGGIGVIIADVSGHGSPAAIVMAMTRLLLHTYPGDISPPAGVLSNVNKLLCGNLLPGHFVTALYGVLAPDGRLVCSNAGHCRPLHYSASSGEVVELEFGAGLPLGVVSEGGYSESATELADGDVLILYTDGLKEALNWEKEMYGDQERMERVLAGAAKKNAEGIKEDILADLFGFVGDEPINDDLTFIVIKSGG